LPCVIAFVDGVGQDRIIGFEGLGNGDSFQTAHLEARLLAAGVLTRTKINKEDERRRAEASRRKAQEEEVDDDDWD